MLDHKKIPFPKNYDRFIALGKEAIAMHHMKKAAYFFEEAYHIHADFSLNFLLVGVYLELGEYTVALQIARQMKKEYLSNFTYLEVFVQVLLFNHRFLEAHVIINEKILAEKESPSMPQLISLKKKIRQRELIYQQLEMHNIAQIQEKLLHLKDCSYLEQLSIIKQSHQLPQEIFLKISKKILMDSSIHYLVRAWILEELYALHVKEKIPFIWQDQTKKEVIPANMEMPLDSLAYQQAHLFLEAELSNVDPILLFNILEEVRIHFVLLYPLADQFVTDPRLWTIGYLVNYDDCLREKYKHEALEDVLQVQHHLRFQLAKINE